MWLENTQRKKDMNLFGSELNITGALISDCGKYRYKLWRIWDPTKPKVLFIMHNPSTADHNTDDPTIRRCIDYAKQWGFGGIYVGNVYPYRATDPAELKKIGIAEASGDFMLMWKSITEMKEICELHVLAHGNTAFSDGDIFHFGDLNGKPHNYHYLKLTKSGNPCHPLYLKKNLKPIKYK